MCQIESLRVGVQERDDEICDLRHTLSGYVDLSETNRLKEEISLLKQQNCKALLSSPYYMHLCIIILTAGEQSQKILQIASLLEAKEFERQKASANSEKTMQMYEDQCKELRRVHNELKRLKECLRSLERSQQELNAEVSRVVAIEL